MLFLASGVYSVGGRILGGNLAYYLEQKKNMLFLWENNYIYYYVLIYLYHLWKKKLRPPPWKNIENDILNTY